MKNTLSILLCILLISCKSDKDEYTYLDLSKSSYLHLSDVIYSFEDELITDLKIADSLAFILQRKNDYTTIVLDINKKEVLSIFGLVGHALEDVINPDFITTINDSIWLEDTSSKKMMRIGAKRENNNFRFEKLMDYPSEIFPSSNINLSNNFIVGRKIDMIKGKMFYIYNQNTHSMVEIDYYPVIKGLTNNPNYFYAPNLALNETKNTIIAGMYFFDIFHIYDLTGKRLKTICLSNNCMPELDGKTKSFDLAKGFSGIIRMFPTNNFCYLLRLTETPEVNDQMKKEFSLIQINWEGELVNSYIIEDQLCGQFYIDEKTSKMYAIRNYVNPEQNEIYEVIAYQLK